MSSHIPKGASERSPVSTIRKRFRALDSVLSEKLRRLWAGSEAQALGRGGIAAVAQATGLSRATVGSGLRELKQGGVRPAPQVRVRRSGGGRKALTELDPSVLSDLESLVEASTRGDPQSALRWTCKSTAKLAGELRLRGHRIGPRTVAELQRYRFASGSQTFFLPSKASARLQTFSTVNPYSRISTVEPAGTHAPSKSLSRNSRRVQ